MATSNPDAITCLNAQLVYTNTLTTATGVPDSCVQNVMDAMIPAFEACSKPTSVYGFSSLNPNYNSPLSFKAWCMGRYGVALTGPSLDASSTTQDGGGGFPGLPLGLGILPNPTAKPVVLVPVSSAFTSTAMAPGPTNAVPVVIASKESPSSNENPGLPPAAYAGILAGFVVVAGAMAAVWYVRKNRVSAEVDAEAIKAMDVKIAAISSEAAALPASAAPMGSTSDDRKGKAVARTTGDGEKTSANLYQPRVRRISGATSASLPRYSDQSKSE
ncbi:hypothetical protein BCR33DRAFT_770096 [Rhizoclosmatium globosum]|uniref:Uncharacterized protein n=1 Tax=Rhizoclosmatium globosum TaxID=329046 RepID=A0A1Y2BQC0_9FUNG|nr:hypothetical protein BCR33DRAFT_770096 [Rhizoclosmatium globosum]|eukprot:ORY36916.1 hypothetical protein BCR33DRAFT_770096 [Rhizoclosmatium globosum]